MMTHWFNVRSSLPTQSYFELKLEDLVASPEAVLRSICRFAGISFDRVMLKMDLSRSHSGRWKREYNGEEKAKVQAILADIIEELGYDPAA
jgi:hypothetical protein